MKKLTTIESLPKNAEEKILEKLHKQLGLTVLKAIEENYPRPKETTNEEQPRTVR